MAPESAIHVKVVRLTELLPGLLFCPDYRRVAGAPPAGGGARGGSLFCTLRGNVARPSRCGRQAIVESRDRHESKRPRIGSRRSRAPALACKRAGIGREKSIQRGGK